LIKYGPKTSNTNVLQEIYSCILLIVDAYGSDGVQLEEICNFLVFGCGNKAIGVRNEAICVIKQLYSLNGYQVLEYLKDIKSSTMTVINQELNEVDLPDNLKISRKISEKIEMDDEMLASPSKEPDENETYEEVKEEFIVSPVKTESLQVNEDHKSQPVHTPESIGSKASSRNSERKSYARGSMSQQKRESKFGKTMKKSEPKVMLEIKDIGNKEAREKNDLKTLWSPGELRTDIILKIKNQIQYTFGSKVESDCFSTDFKKHIGVLKLFESVFENDFSDIDGFFGIIDLIFKWIFIKGCEGSNVNTKFLVEIINFLDSLIDFLD